MVIGKPAFRGLSLGYMHGKYKKIIYQAKVWPVMIADHLVCVQTISWMTAESPPKPSGYGQSGSVRQSIFRLKSCWKEIGPIKVKSEWYIPNRILLTTCRTSSGFPGRQGVVDCSGPCWGRLLCRPKCCRMGTKHIKCTHPTCCRQTEPIRTLSTGQEGSAVSWRKLIPIWIWNLCSIAQRLWQLSLYKDKIFIN